MQDVRLGSETTLKGQGTSWPAILLFLTSIVLFAIGSPVQAAQKLTSVSVPRGWKGAVYTTESGHFSHCVANASYKSNFVLFVSIDSAYYWKVGFLDRRKRLRNGRTAARIRIDRSRWLIFRTRVSRNNFFVLNMPGNSQFIRLFRRGRQMALEIDGSNYLFNLTNTSSLMPALARCVKRYETVRVKPR